MLFPKVIAWLSWTTETGEILVFCTLPAALEKQKTNFAFIVTEFFSEQ